MSKATQLFPTEVVSQQSRSLEWTKQAGIVIGASLFVALCARVTVPLPFTPVPLTMQNFGVLAVGLMLGSRRGFAALALYLAEGAAGLPVFSPSALGGGIPQMLGPTGGFLLAYPLVAFVAGWLYGKLSASGLSRFAGAALSSVAAEALLFASGLGWLAVQTHSIATAIRWGLYWFIFAEVIKVLVASAVASRLNRRISPQA